MFSSYSIFGRSYEIAIKAADDITKRFLFKSTYYKNVQILPRLTGKDKTMKCKHCQFKTRCWDKDGEIIEAMKLAIEQHNSPGKLLNDIGMPSVDVVVVTNHIND